MRADDNRCVVGKEGDSSGVSLIKKLTDGKAGSTKLLLNYYFVQYSTPENTRFSSLNIDMK